MKRLITPLLAALALSIAAAAVGVGCDDSEKVPQAVLEQASKPPSNSLHPTTQDLLTGHRSRTILLPIPVSLEMPPGWGPDHRTGIANLIMGYTPSGGEISIQLIPRTPMRPKELETLVAAAKKEMAANPGKILKCDLRPLGTAQVLERQRVGDPAPLTTYDKNNKPHESIESYFEWTLDVLVPHEDGIQDHQIAFLGLTKSQYDKDKDFLNSVMSTLQYATASEPGTTTAPMPPATTDSILTTRPTSETPAATIKP